MCGEKVGGDDVQEEVEVDVGSSKFTIHPVKQYTGYCKRSNGVLPPIPGMPAISRDWSAHTIGRGWSSSMEGAHCLERC